MAASLKNAWKKYILHFAHDHLEKNPFLEIELPSNNAASQIMSRLVLGKSIYELWGKASCVDDLLLKLKSSNINNPCSSSDTSFKIDVECFNRTQTMEQKIERIQLKFNGRVNLSKPQHKFSLLEFYEYDSVNPKEAPQQVYFGRWVRSNTSMDPTLSLLMATMGQVKANDLVFDPFVGSGGWTLGIVRTFWGICKPSRKGQKWRFRDETILNNLRQYNLEKHYVDAFVADFTSYKLWCTDQPRFDAIITDPPYGVREPSQKLGKHKQSKSQQDKETAETSAANCYPTKTSYHLTNMLLDLLDFAARTLTLGGRLVFWMPIVRDIYVPENIPHHPCLKLVSNSEQIFFIRVSRRLITMEKVTEFNVRRILT
ncbi:hypothetical protein CAPTEDRAFT_4285 [Capitella teleta]|uniref:tRNA (guanine(10)-N(2))-methyltransferase TRMT11 N-terminal domain-containing protein n=1 Tax=Capitella teleta TaxID=283909 RepID=R7US63_CAPTE|nr:hypothetical protein CAPTEDRAFT_4285 [Capitella teleta]|eukprot:ELU09035.1 hypothetical protein CAPTEDRAFT_4285 [Capitella teleta]